MGCSLFFDGLCEFFPGAAIALLIHHAVLQECLEVQTIEDVGQRDAVLVGAHVHGAEVETLELW